MASSSVSKTSRFSSSAAWARFRPASSASSFAFVRDHDEGRQRETEALGLAHEIQAALVGHAQVDQHRIVRRCSSQSGQRLGAGAGDFQLELRSYLREVPQGQVDIHPLMFDIEDPAWLGGLLEHVLSMCEIARRVGQHYISAGYPVDLDLLLAGVLLHDIGKIDELNYARSFSYSTPGQLLGHIVMGVQMIEEKLRGLPDFPCKSVGIVEYSTFAKALNPRIHTGCLTCPPYGRAKDGWCSWEFTLEM